VILSSFGFEDQVNLGEVLKKEDLEDGGWRRKKGRRGREGELTFPDENPKGQGVKIQTAELLFFL